MMDNCGEGGEEEERQIHFAESIIEESDVIYSSGESEEESDDGDDDDDDEGEVDDEIVEQFMCTFSNGDYDTEINNALICPNRSDIVPARPTQASYIKPDNWVERNRIGLKKVKRQLQDWIEAVSHGSSFGIYLNHNSGGYYHDTLMDNEEPIVWHESILHEYWDQLEEAVDEMKKKMRQLDIAPDIQEVYIDNVEITKESMSKLVAIFTATNSCACANFNNSNLCGEGIISLSKLVDASSQLSSLRINHNRIDIMLGLRNNFN
jgi:hypothetical protein